MADDNGMGLIIPCDRCDEVLTEPGGLLFSPPSDGHVRKLHLCRVCWRNVVGRWGGGDSDG